MVMKGSASLKNFLSLMALQKFSKVNRTIFVEVKLKSSRREKEIPILIASVHSGGEDLNLTEASMFMYFDYCWNPPLYAAGRG